MGSRSVEKITASKKFPRFATKVWFDTDWEVYKIDSYVDRVNLGEGPRAEADTKEEALQHAEFSRNYESGKYAEKTVKRYDTVQKANKKRAETNALKRSKSRNGLKYQLHVAKKKAEKDRESVPVKEMVKKFLSKDPSDSEIEKFYINKVLPLDNRSMDEILTDNLSSIRYKNRKKTAEEARERYKDVSPPWPITQKKLDKSSKKR